MTLEEAYQDALSAIEELKADHGITVTIRPSASRYNPSLCELLGGLDRLPPEKWVFVTFSCDMPLQAQAVYEAAQGLRWLGISFDTSGNRRVRDWALDWSFQVAPDGIDAEAEHRASVVEETLICESEEW